MLEEIEHGLKMGLPGASSIEDRTIPTFSRGELPHFAGINTFLKAPYVEDANLVGDYDATVVGIPFDGGCTYRAGTRFGPQGIRRISALYTPYNYEKGIDLREEMTLCDVGDCFTIPANLEVSGGMHTQECPAEFLFCQLTFFPSITRFSNTFRNPLIKSATPSRTLPPPAHSQSSWVETTLSAFLPSGALHPLHPRILVSFTSIATLIFRKKTWMNVCTLHPTFMPRIFQM